MLAGVVIWFDRGSAAQFYAAIFISIVFLLLDTALRPYYDFRCNALKTLVSTSMVITLLCGLCSKLDPDSEVIGESTLGWTLVVVNGIIVLLVLCLELIRRALSVVRGVRSGISYLKNTETVSPSGMKAFDGEFRQSPQDAVVSANVETYPLHAYPNSRSVYGKLVALGDTENICQIHGIEVERGVLYVAAKPYASNLLEHVAAFQTCTMATQDFCRAVIEGLAQLHSMQITHGNINPASHLLNGSKLIFSDFSRAKLAEGDVTSASEFRADINMAASTILFALSGGRTSELDEWDFQEIVTAAEAEFPDNSLFGGVKAGRAELMDLLRTMVGTQIPLHECLERPFFWSKTKTVEYIGEEIGVAFL
jgi:hypothetical protein